EHYDIAALEKSAHRLCGAKNRGEIGPPRSVYRSGHSNDEKIRLRKRLRFGGINQRRLPQLCFLDFMRAVEAGMQLFNPCTIDIESEHRGARASERHRHGKPDIAKANHRNASSLH